MDKHQMAWNEKTAQVIIKNLEKRRMEGSYAADAGQALEEVLTMIPPGATIFRCGSVTATAMGLWGRIKARPELKLLDPFEPGLASGGEHGDPAPGSVGGPDDRQLQRHYPGRQAG